MSKHGHTLAKTAAFAVSNAKYPLKQKLRKALAGNAGSVNPSLIAKVDIQRNNLTKLVFAENAIALLKPSLAAYENCDIIDVNPGVGLWSAELHTALKPRSHLLLEPEDKLYHPFLDPLLKKRNSKYHYAPLDGYDFTTYHRIWHEDLLGIPQTSISDASRLNPSRDSLLLVANLSRYNSSLRKGVVHNPGFVIQQLINATWTRKMFQRYGLVRMLVWMQDEYKAHIIPRRVIYRKRQTLLLGSSADIQEVAGAGNPHSTQRDPAIDFLRSRTEKSGNLIPEASNPLQSEYISNPLSPESNHDTKAQNSMLNKPRDGRYTDWRAELASLEEDLRKGIFKQHKASTGPLKRQNTPQYAKLDQLRRKLKFVEQWQGKKVLLVDLVERSNKLERAVLEESLHEDEKAQLRQEVEHLQREVTKKMNELRQAELAELTSNIDDRQAIRQDPALLHWDRRLFEPLTTEPEQFYPQYPLALLDFQFRSTPYMAKSQEDADYAELFEAFASALFINPGYPIKKALDTIAPGAGDALLPKAPSLKDPLVGGRTKLDDMRVRMLTPEMLRELVLAWGEWPFKPTKTDFMLRTGTAGGLAFDETSLQNLGP